MRNYSISLVPPLIELTTRSNGARSRFEKRDKQIMSAYSKYTVCSYNLRLDDVLIWSRRNVSRLDQVGKDPFHKERHDATLKTSVMYTTRIEIPPIDSTPDINSQSIPTPILLQTNNQAHQRDVITFCKQYQSNMPTNYNPTTKRMRDSYVEVLSDSKPIPERIESTKLDGKRCSNGDNFGDAVRSGFAHASTERKFRMLLPFWIVLIWCIRFLRIRISRFRGS